MKRDPRRAKDRAQDILDAIANIHKDIGDLNKNAFLEDGKTQRAVIESFIVVGEAANRLCDLRPDIESENSDLSRKPYNSKYQFLTGCYERSSQTHQLKSHSRFMETAAI